MLGLFFSALHFSHSLHTSQLPSFSSSPPPPHFHSLSILESQPSLPFLFFYSLTRSPPSPPQTSPTSLSLSSSHTHNLFKQWARKTEPMAEDSLPLTSLPCPNQPNPPKTLVPFLTSYFHNKTIAFRRGQTVAYGLLDPLDHLFGQLTHLHSLSLFLCTPNKIETYLPDSMVIYLYSHPDYLLARSSLLPTEWTERINTGLFGRSNTRTTLL